MSANVLASTENLPYEDWLEYRKQGIGGSDAAVACGIGRYKSPVELWLEKTGQLPNQEAGEAAYWGTQLEPLVRAEFTRRTGIEVTHTKQLLQSAEHPFMLANLDGTCEHPDFGPCIFEAKTASAYKAKEWDNSIPEEYLLQIQHYMAVTGYRGAYIAALIGGNTFRWKFVERDEGLIAVMIRLEAEFWGYVQDGTPRPWTARKPPPGSCQSSSRPASLSPRSHSRTLQPTCSANMILPVSNWRCWKGKSGRPRTC